VTQRIRTFSPRPGLSTGLRLGVSVSYVDDPVRFDVRVRKGNRQCGQFTRSVAPRGKAQKSKDAVNARRRGFDVTVTLFTCVPTSLADLVQQLANIALQLGRLTHGLTDSKLRARSTARIA
jgi:hypothetical protein